MGVYIRGMEMPKNCGECLFKHLSPTGESIVCDLDLSTVSWESRPFDCPLVPVPPHGRLIDADALAKDLKRQCEEVFKIDAVSPDDFWITRDHAYNERLWKTWCESFFEYLKERDTVIPASEEGET